MNIDDLKSDWQMAGGKAHSETELAMMTRVRNHPVLRKLRRKFIIEIAGLTALLLLFYDGFDGAEKPTSISIMLIFSILLYILNNALAYLKIQNPAITGNIRDSLAKQSGSLKQMAVLSMISSAFYATTLIYFLTYQITFTQRKYVILSLLILSFLLLFFYSWISWKRKISHFNQMQADF